MGRLTILIATAWLFAGCSEKPPAPFATPAAVSVLAIHADVSDAGRAELARSHIQNITSVEFCRRSVRAMQVSHPELSWLARFAQSADPVEAAANDLVAALHASVATGGHEIRLELSLEPASESAVVLGVAGNVYIEWARAHRTEELEKSRRLYCTHLDDVQRELAWIVENDIDAAWKAFQLSKGELRQLLTERAVIHASAEGLVASVVAAGEWEEWIDATVESIQNARRSQDKIDASIMELAQRVSTFHPSRHPGVVREEQRRLWEAIERLDIALCEMESVEHWPVRWSKAQ